MSPRLAAMMYHAVERVAREGGLSADQCRDMAATLRLVAWQNPEAAVIAEGMATAAEWSALAREVAP